MARIFITGSTDGLGMLAAKALIGDGHDIVVHARSATRAQEAMKKIVGAESVFAGDLSDIDETIKLGEEINNSGAFDIVIHNAGVYQAAAKTIFAVNTLAPYILTCLIDRPKRLIYLSSGMHLSGSAKLDEFSINTNRISYSDSKLHILMLSIIVSRKWPGVYSNAVDPGWVPTRMGGRGAPDDLQKGYETQVWLATSNDEKAKVSGRYFHHKKERSYNKLADDGILQDKFLERCKDITGITLPVLK